MSKQKGCVGGFLNFAPASNQHMALERVIGRYTGPEKGPLMLCFGGIHGNEPAGVQALEIVFQMLEREPEVNPGFVYRGRLLGLRGNLQALEKGVRYVDRDLNRLWTAENVQRVLRAPGEGLLAEEREMRELLLLIHQELEEYRPEKFVVLDIHTTTASGGIFSLATDDPESLRIAVNLHAPVITGMLHGIRGTTMHYFNNEHFEPQTVPVVFEAGQHDEQLSVNRAIAAIINCMRTIGSVRPEDVENRHDELLIEYSRGLPKVAELLYTHPVQENDGFRMRPDYLNFQPVKRGEVLAYDRRGPVAAPVDGLILMPLYQPQGDDGFFIVRRVEY